MAKWVYIRGWDITPQSTLVYMSAANAFLKEAQTTWGITVDDIDFISTGSAILMSMTYSSSACVYPSLTA